MTKRPGTLLIVEDDALIAAQIEDAVKQAGYQALPPVRTASEAMDLARAHHPDLALVDIALDGQLNGIQLASQLRDELNIRSIFISGHNDPQTVSESRLAHPASWLKKPFAPGSVVASVQLALKG